MKLSISDEAVIENQPQFNQALLERNSWKRPLYENSALYRYFTENVNLEKHVWNVKSFVKGVLKGGDTNLNMNVNVNVVREYKQQIDLAVRYVLDRIRVENPTKRVIFVIDGLRTDIYRDTRDTLETSDLYFLHQTLSKYCSEARFDFIDLSKPMQADYRKNKTQFNSDYDFHWNEYGHNFVALELMKHFSMFPQVGYR